jgi:hypothetical protein
VRATAARWDGGSIPPTIFGMFFVVNFSLPGSSSREKARKKSRPHRRPPADKRGSNSWRVVPG